MSVVRLGINGFGRIGRLTFRAAMANQSSNARVMAINDPFMDTDYLIYLLKYDSVHGNHYQISYLLQEDSNITLRRLMEESKSMDIRLKFILKRIPVKLNGVMLVLITFVRALVLLLRKKRQHSIYKEEQRKQSSQLHLRMMSPFL